MFKEVSPYDNALAPGDNTGACPAKLDVWNYTTYIKDLLLQSFSVRSGDWADHETGPPYTIHFPGNAAFNQFCTWLCT